jgi:peptide/nickel transport system permease protein
MIGLVILVVAALDTLLAPLLVDARAYESYHVAETFQLWSGAHPLGTDNLGRDELARLLVGIHSSVLFAGMALLLAVVLGLIILGAVRLVGRTRGQEWGRWAELAVVPVIGVILLGIVSFVVDRQFPANIHFPGLFSIVLKGYVWDNLTRWQSEFATNVFVVLVDLLVVGEVARFGYLLIQRLRQVKALPAPGASVPAWLSIVGPAAVVGLWIAADALLIEPSLLDFGVGLPPPPIPSLGWMLDDASGYAASQPQLVAIPLTVVLVVYAALNLVGFGLRGVLQRAATN